MNCFEKISEILMGLSGMDSISPEQRLQDDLSLDSLAMVTLLILLEEKFEIELKEADMNPFDLVTVQNVLNMVAGYLEEVSHEREEDC